MDQSNAKIRKVNRVYKQGIILLALLLFSMQCEKAPSEKEDDEQILARVGSSVITIDEFRNNYEFGFAHLKPKKNSKKHYLVYMINEKLLADDCADCRCFLGMGIKVKKILILLGFFV